MIDDKILDEMNLPWASSNETLEIISTNYFLPLFNPDFFLIRPEAERDKGIDHHIEIKKGNKYLNFRFVIQLKATDSKGFNNDGSISLQLDTSNINYLLNNPMPAFYVLFFKETNTFYYESINDFAQSLYKKDANWNTQPSHVLRFLKPFNESAIEEIFQLTLKKGKFQRTINEKVIAQSITVNTGDRILIDNDLNVSDDSEIRKLIEGIGLEIINEGKWKDIIFVHKKASGNVASTSKYNLVLGIANYYSGNLMDALSFFRTAANLKSELTEDLKNHLLFFEATVKYSIGLISNAEYESKMQQLESADNVGLYIKLEKAKRKYIESLNINTKDRYENFVSDINAIITDPKANDSIKLNAKCELILFEGYKNNMEYVKGVSMINAFEESIGPNIQLRVDSAKRFISANETWFKNVQQLKEDAINTKNHFAYYIAIINEVKVSYEFEVYTANVFIVQDTAEFPKPEIPNKEPFFERMLEKISKAVSYFYHIGHIENTVVALSTKYEILHYLNRIEESKKVLYDLESIIESFDLVDQRKKLEILKNNGATHQHFKVWMDKIFSESEAKKGEYDKMRSEMIKMDEKESTIIKKPTTKNLHIHLFPIGYFQFPMAQKENVYEILNLTQEAKNRFDEMFKMVIPVANICYIPISQEGYVDGKLGDTGIEVWRNIFRIRKSFYENKYYRYEPNL
ncbi:DUF4365 domain-containing protein [Cyclobacterium roseum]|uniref:DUF4365 domain-containing protein n=1 Tax=Cyclobacterium roseum TaxID=2666137 RepID=UPI001391542B|nr:DUF4365 domain-containing protein [Cyclobacterium roseum]